VKVYFSETPSNEYLGSSVTDYVVANCAAYFSWSLNCSSRGMMVGVWVFVLGERGLAWLAVLYQ
jgi:hypothetical protein